MCGITAIISADSEDHDLIEKATNLLTHRGPDSYGYHHSGFVSLGHRRLSILDLSPAASQPLPNENGEIHIVCNGEIYNYIELNEALVAAGHKFRSHSDSETLLHLYEEHGLNFLDNANGMFAFVIWDAKRRRLIAAVDRFGKKPLYYAQYGGRLIFASELKSLLVFPWVERGIDPLAIDRYLTLRYVPAPLSIYKSIRKVTPATMLVWEDGRLDQRRYWTPSPSEDANGDADGRFEELFTSAVGMRMRSDVPLGVYLSGGVDSAAVAGVMRRLGEGRRVSFTLSVDYKYDERERARRIADHLGFEFNPVEVEEGDFGLMPKIAYHLDEPFGDLLGLPAYILAREAKRKLTVVLTGDGADEILGGYFHQKLMMAWRGWRPLFGAPGVGKFMSAMTSAMPASLLNAFFDYPDRLGPREKQKLAQTLEKAAGFGGFYDGVTSCFTAADKAGLYTSEFAGTLPDEPISLEYEREMEAWKGFSFLSRLSLLDLKYWIPFSVVYRLDKLNMAHAVETRSPFLDYRVVETCLNLPGKLKLTGGRNKIILRGLIERLYPPDLREKGKQAFYMPVAPKYRRPFHEWISGLLTPEKVAARGLFRQEYIESLMRHYEKGSMLANRQLAALAMLELWFDTFEGRETRS